MLNKRKKLSTALPVLVLGDKETKDGSCSIKRLKKGKDTLLGESEMSKNLKASLV